MIPGLLDQALTQIINHPDTWDQSDWFCGTKACLAGHICLLAGAKPLNSSDPDVQDMGIVTYDGTTRTAFLLAEQLCGLLRWEGTWMWAADRTMPDLYEAVTRISNDQALTCWRPATDQHDGPQWIDGDGWQQIIVHRASTADWCRDHWQIKHHPTRQLARSWAAGIAHRHGLAPSSARNKETHTA